MTVFRRRTRNVHWHTPSPKGKVFRTPSGSARPVSRSETRPCGLVFKSPGVRKFWVWIPVLPHSWSVSLGRLLKISAHPHTPHFLFSPYTIKAVGELLWDLKDEWQLFSKEAGPRRSLHEWELWLFVIVILILSSSSSPCKPGFPNLTLWPLGPCRSLFGGGWVLSRCIVVFPASLH